MIDEVGQDRDLMISEEIVIEIGTEIGNEVAIEIEVGIEIGNEAGIDMVNIFQRNNPVVVRE